jgi:hypothetical protein
MTLLKTIHPPTLTIKLTLQQRNQLLKFLERAQLSGAEVPPFVAIHNLLTSAKPTPEPDPS